MAKTRPWAAWTLSGLRAAIGVLFAVSGYLKLMAPYENFRASIMSYEMVSAPLADLMAQGLPWLELVSGVLLAAGLWGRLTLAAVWAMNSLFIVVLGSSMARGLLVKDCGCFGKAVTLSPQQTLWMDIAIWAALLLIFLFPSAGYAYSLDRVYEKK